MGVDMGMDADMSIVMDIGIVMDVDIDIDMDMDGYKTWTGTYQHTERAKRYNTTDH